MGLNHAYLEILSRSNDKNKLPGRLRITNPYTPPEMAVQARGHAGDIVLPRPNLRLGGFVGRLEQLPDGLGRADRNDLELHQVPPLQHPPLE